MVNNWKSTLWDILITILTLGISHIQKHKKKLEAENKSGENPGNEKQPYEK